MQSVVAAHVFNKVPLEEIAEDHPHVPLGALYAVVAYYYAHQAEMDAEYEAEVAWGEEQIAKQEREWGAAAGTEPGSSSDAPSTERRNGR
jgi:hypothetical protein